MDEQPKKELISLDEIINMNFYPKAFNGSFLNDTTLMFKDEFHNLVTFQIGDKDFNRRILVKNITFVRFLIFDFCAFYLSNDT